MLHIHKHTMPYIWPSDELFIPILERKERVLF